MKKIAILASGTGTNALNLIGKAFTYSDLKISCVIVDQPDSTLPEKLTEEFPQIPVYKIFPDESLSKENRKAQLDKKILSQLNKHQTEWVLLAGYMRMIGPAILRYFEGRIYNIHPSLLPCYPGLRAYERAFTDKSSSGVTIHLVDAGLDSGPVIIQKPFPYEESDTLSEFMSRGKKLEWELYPKVLEIILNSPSHSRVMGESL